MRFPLRCRSGLQENRLASHSSVSFFPPCNDHLEVHAYSVMIGHLFQKREFIGPDLANLRGIGQVLIEKDMIDTVASPKLQQRIALTASHAHQRTGAERII